jgi:hypothetical protein
VKSGQTACSAWRIQGALDAIDQALEQVLIARTEREQRWQVNQVNLAVSPVHRDAGPFLCLDPFATTGARHEGTA